jgi:20S proteasome alpha/beta subunit
MEQQFVLELTQYAITGIAVVFSVFTLVGAFRSGALTKIKMGNLEIASNNVENQNIRSAIENSVSGKDDIPYEVEQLTNYYSQILSQSKVSFWFSLVFASLGFVVIVLAAFLYSADASGTTVVQFIAGLVMEAVSSLFFVQSKNSQKSMGEFFDKLRSDRLHLESRKMCDDIQSVQVQDALKLHLSLHYAGVGNSEGIAKHISETVLITPNKQHNTDYGAVAATAVS